MTTTNDNDNNDDDATPNDAAAQEARAKAEARRQRILEKSRERMVVVAGERPTAAEAAATSLVMEETKQEDDESKEADAEAPGNEDATPPQQQQQDAPPAKPSGASRMQAMRRRRFKKTAQAKEADETEVAKEAEATPSSPDTAAAPSAEDTTAAVQETKEETTTEPIVVSAETKKKYKGVAKMRREMLKKKEAQAKQQQEESSAVETTTPIIMRKQAPVSLLPIMLHFVAVLLLFFAGVDIGWNQALHSDVVVYRELSPPQNGIGLVNRYVDFSFSSKTTLLDASKLQDSQEFTGGDEFVASEEEEYIPNIDPIFRVDLDELTKGGGAFNTIARGAIYMHRLLLQLFYYLPLSIMRTMLSIPQQLLATPPILCMISLVVRQFAKLLGGKLPEPSSEKADKQDVLAMLKNGIMSFLAGMFPTVVTAYDVWTHLRSDMYVILCGVFVGLGYTYHVGNTIIGESSGTDEL